MQYGLYFSFHIRISDKNTDLNLFFQIFWFSLMRTFYNENIAVPFYWIISITLNTFNFFKFSENTVKFISGL